MAIPYQTAQLKSTNIFVMAICIFGAQLPNLIPANISGCTALPSTHATTTCIFQICLQYPDLCTLDLGSWVVPILRPCRRPSPQASRHQDLEYIRAGPNPASREEVKVIITSKDFAW